MKGKIGAVVLGIFMVIALVCCFALAKRVPTGYKGVAYNMNGGVNGEVVDTGWHIIPPTKRIKLFTVGNEQLLLTKDKREGSRGDDSFKVSTADDASIAISFQMSYRFNEGSLVDTYKKFKGMSGEDIVNQRVKTVLKSKVSEVTTNHSMMDIYSGNRAQINEEITNYLNDAFMKSYYVVSKKGVKK